MTKREMLLEQLEETAFALMMEEVAKEEGKKALEENERLKADDSFIVPESTYRKGIVTIKRYFSQKNRQPVMRTVSKVVSRVAVIVLVMLLLFATAFATIPELRSKTLNLIIEVFDDRTRITFGEEGPIISASNTLVSWVPDGFELVDKGESDFSAWEEYNNSDGALIEANIYFGEGVAYGVDTEEALVENITVKGYAAKVIHKANDIEVVFSVKENMRIYYVRGEDVGRDVVLHVAESMDIQ